MREEDKKRILEETKDMSPFEVLDISDTKELGSEEERFYVEIYNKKMADSIQKDLDEKVANGGYYWTMKNDKYVKVTKQGDEEYSEEEFKSMAHKGKRS